jgi:hypothetical protein
MEEIRYSHDLRVPGTCVIIVLITLFHITNIVTYLEIFSGDMIFIRYRVLHC